MSGYTKSRPLSAAKYLLNPEYKRLEEIMGKYRKTNVRDCLLIELAMATGARATEVLNLRLEDFNATDRSVYITGLKTGNDREIPLGRALFNRAHKYASQQKGGVLFPITYGRLRELWNIYRPVKKRFHSIRHSFAIRLYTKTKDIKLVQHSMGHKLLDTTTIYMDYVYSQSELRKAFGVR